MNIGNRETGSLYINKNFYLYIVGNFGAFPFDFDKRHHDQMTAPPAPKKIFRKKIGPTFVNRNGDVVPLHRWKLRAGFAPPRTKNYGPTGAAQRPSE